MTPIENTLFVLVFLWLLLLSLKRRPKIEFDLDVLADEVKDRIVLSDLVPGDFEDDVVDSALTQDKDKKISESNSLK